MQLKIALGELIAERARSAAATDDPIIRRRLAQLYIESEILRLNAYRGLTAIMKTACPARRARSPSGSGRTPTRRSPSWRWTSRPERADPSTTASGPTASCARAANSIEGGTTEILKNIVAERVLGLPRLR